MSEGTELADFISRVAGEGKLRIEENLGNGYVRLRVSEAERRQAKHDIRCVEDVVVEMLRNARDAGARHVYLATAREGDMRTLVFLDDGVGVPEPMRSLIFEARVTSKLETVHMDRWGVHGRGMALFSIRENVEHAAVVTSGEGLGTSFLVKADCTSLSERADQSTWPTVELDEEGGDFVARGPRNIARAVVEFALDCREGVEVFLGSPAEVVATLFEHDPAELPLRDILFCDDVSTLPVCSRLRGCADASELAQCAGGMGLVLSERTAHRILSGDIKPLRPVLHQVLPSHPARAGAEVDIYKDRRGLKVDADDLEAFSSDLTRAFDSLAEGYYISLAQPPRIRVSRDKITVTFDIAKDD